MLVYISCRKTDLQSEKITEKTGSSIENKFFASHRSPDPEENTIVEFIKRINGKTPFVESTVKQIGYPRWDKAIKTKPPAKSSSIKVASTGQTRTTGSSPSNYDIYYIPFVRDSQNQVNASMVIKMSATDTSVSYLCDWQYRQLQNDDNKLNDEAANFAIFFMFLDKTVFGHTKFQILDKNIFTNNGHSPESIELNSHSASANIKINQLVLEEFCQDVTFSWNDCPFLSSGRPCRNQPYCDRCSEYCTASLSYTYCWQEWVGGGGGGGGDGGGGTGGSGGGGDTGVGAIPPNPCEQPTPGSIRVSQTQTNPGVKVNFLCNVSPGWTPDPYAPEQLELMGNQEGWYWDDPANFTPVAPYDPNVDGPYRSDGFRRNGPSMQFKDGTVQNWIDNNGKKIATFTGTNGVSTDFPDAYISDSFTPKNKAYTTTDGTIHADNLFDLANLQHEYGHVLQIQAYGKQ